MGRRCCVSALLLAAVGCGGKLHYCDGNQDAQCPKGDWCKASVCVDAKEDPFPQLAFDGLGLSQGEVQPSVDLPVPGITNVFFQFSNPTQTAIPPPELQWNIAWTGSGEPGCSLAGPWYVGMSRWIGRPTQIEPPVNNETPPVGTEDLPPGGKLIVDFPLQPDGCPLDGWVFNVVVYKHTEPFPFHFTTHAAP